MIHFGQPWWLLLLAAIPVLAWLKGRHGQQPAFLYSSVQLVRAVMGLNEQKSGRFQRSIRWLILALLIGAMARPQIEHSSHSSQASGIDIVLALDLSGSMAAEDFTVGGTPVNRVVIAKEVMAEFIRSRPSDRMGLIAFAGKAYVAGPITLDHAYLQSNLSRLDLGQLREDGTAIGSAIAAACNRLKDLPSKSRIVVLMTDGENTETRISPLTAAEAAKALDVRVYTIGVGTRGLARVPVGVRFGRTVYEEQKVNIDEKTLKEIADLTGGKYYRAGDSKEFKNIYSEIDRLEKSEVQVQEFKIQEELFHWLLAPALALVLLEMILTHTVWRKLP